MSSLQLGKLCPVASTHGGGASAHQASLDLGLYREGDSYKERQEVSQAVGVASWGS